MAAPIQGAQVAQQAQQASQKEVQLTKVQDSKFDGVMAQKAQQTQAAGQIQQTAQVQKAQQVSQAQKVQDVAKAEKAQLNKANAVTPRAVEANGKADTSNKADGHSMIEQVMSSVEGHQSEMDKLMQMAMHGGKKMDYQELFVLQTKVYQYSQEMELTSKVVEKATSGLKDTLKTQV